MAAGSWPDPGFPGVGHKQPLADAAIAPKISFLVPPRTHAGGQEQTFNKKPERSHSIPRLGDMPTQLPPLDSDLTYSLRLMEQVWRFDQPRNCAAISVRQVVFAGAPVLLVTHDGDDHGWQFLSGGKVNMKDTLVVAMSEVVDGDPSLHEIAELPPGWKAWRRSLGEPWVREKSPPKTEQPAVSS